MKLRTLINFFALGAIPLAVLVACGSSAKRSNFEGEDDGGGGFGDGSSLEGGDSGGNIGGRDPVNCQEAAQFKTYVGCDYWPTVTGNPVEEIFDFAVAVANVGADAANVTVTGPGGVNEKSSVA